VDKTLKSVVKRQIPFLIGGTITGTIMTYYYGFPFTIIVNSAIWWVISYAVNKYYWKSTGLNDQKYLLQFAMSKLKQEKREVEMHIAPILLSEIIAPFFSEQESDSTTYYIINPIIGSVFEKQLHDII
jgi:hypothetical protein